MKYRELQEENWQLWKQVTVGGVRNTWASRGQVSCGVTGVGFAFKPSSPRDLTGLGRWLCRWKSWRCNYRRKRLAASTWRPSVKSWRETSSSCSSYSP